MSQVNMTYHYYNPNRIPWVPTDDEVWDDRLRKCRSEMAEMLQGRWQNDGILLRHFNTINRVIGWYERRRVKSEQSGASGNLPTTGKPSVQVTDEPSIPQHQPDRVEDSSTRAPIAVSSSGAIVRPSAQKYTEGQFATYLLACNISLFPYPLSEHSRFFPSDDRPGDQHVTNTVEEKPFDETSLRTQRCWARAVGYDTSSNSTGDENYETTS
ncbi:hypothetical protein F4679DRAFT_591628 [Xylaria curta]|nr:hypothetical protein F4679DRAFT_591628 [Xylaria curta]